VGGGELKRQWFRGRILANLGGLRRAGQGTGARKSAWGDREKKATGKDDRKDGGDLGMGGEGIVITWSGGRGD